MDAQTGAHRKGMGTGLAQHSGCALHTPAIVCSHVGLGFMWDLGSKKEDLGSKEEELQSFRECERSQCHCSSRCASPTLTVGAVGAP